MVSGLVLYTKASLLKVAKIANAILRLVYIDKLKSKKIQYCVEFFDIPVSFFFFQKAIDEHVTIRNEKVFLPFSGLNKSERLP
jgi:hypothetical protein